MAAIGRIGMGMASGKALYFQQAAWLILAAMVFDALDGFVARMTRTTSPFGAQLDSLCDMVTFGVAPGFLVFALTRASDPGFMSERLVPAVCLLYSMCALIRLGRFTIESAPDESSHRDFAGLPSPAAAGLVAGAVIPTRELMRIGPELAILLKAALPALALSAAVLMVSRVRYTHVVNRVLRGRRPFVTLVELALVLALGYLFREWVFFLVFFAYAVMGPALWLRTRFFRKTVPSSVPFRPERDQSLF
jgi:CDP-diacylglycerol--serine O-phosphatidyltransferase